MVDHGLLDVNNKFRLKKRKQNKNHQEQFRSLQSRSSLNKTVGKQEFDKFLESQRNLLARKNNTMGAINALKTEE